MASIFERFGKPGLVIIGEIVESLRFKRVSNPSTPTGVFPVGQSGYNPATITGAPSNLSSSGFYTVKNINVGITDVETAVQLIRQSASDSTFSSYNNISMVSLDGLFVPYSIDPNHSGLPHFENPETENKPNIKTLNPFNLDNSLESGILQNGMPSGIEGRWLKYGHNIGLALSKTASDTGVTDLNFEKDYYNTGKTEYNTVRSVAFRGPVIISGPGYSTSGIPVPASGEEFHPEAFWNPLLWKTGPLDIRWDDSKKVWTPKPYYKIRFEIYESDCQNSSAIVKILSRSDGVGSVPGEYEIENPSNPGQCFKEFTEDGTEVCSKFVEVYDKAGCFLNESNVNLVGRIGYADYLYGRPYTNYQPWTAWEITALAEQQTECETT